jgi:hypothetical protein
MTTPDKPSKGKEAGKLCALCGKQLLPEGTNPMFGVLAPGMNLDFSQVARRAMSSLQMASQVCGECGAAVCRGCQPLHANPPQWKNWPNCPKCGGSMRRP